MPEPVSVFLQPGELFSGDTPARVKTVLGSCVAILMRTPGTSRAAMAHCLLPEAGASVDALPRRLALRFVDTTVELMLRMFLRRGGGAAEIEVKLFGGAGRMGGPGAPEALSVGRRNAETALSALYARGLRVASSSLGGPYGRFIEFDTETGEVWVRNLPALPSAEGLCR